MMLRRSLLAGLIVLGVAAPGCAGLDKQATTSSGTSSPNPKTVTASTPNSTVVLHQGDTLVFRPSLELMPPGMAWNLVTVPRQLRRTSKPGVFPFRFSVVHSGTGKLQVAVGRRCGAPPGPAVAGPNCPVQGEGQTSGATGMPMRLVTITVKVDAPGDDT